MQQRLSAYSRNIFGSNPVTAHPLLCSTPIATTPSGTVVPTSAVSRSLNSNCSTCPDLLHPRILKQAADSIATAYTSLFQLCTHSGVFPKMRPSISKKDNRHLSSSHRPIGLTTTERAWTYPERPFAQISVFNQYSRPFPGKTMHQYANRYWQTDNGVRQ